MDALAKHLRERCSEFFGQSAGRRVREDPGESSEADLRNCRRMQKLATLGGDAFKIEKGKRG